eukprot:scaffold8695_cov103-Cylindrotheca_fusiformis.AAC.1
MPSHEAEDVVWIYSSDGQEDNKEVPETVRRLEIAENITRIPDEAFKGHQELEEVTFSSFVQEIGRSACFGCKRLKSIRYRQTLGEGIKEVGIPSNVKVIDDSAFQGCTRLEGLGLNEGLERIGKDAFEECVSLTEVNFPSTVN